MDDNIERNTSCESRKQGNRDQDLTKLNLHDIDKYSQEAISRLSKLKFEINKTYTSKELVELFRACFGIGKYNQLIPSTKYNNILCYDLMICENPLSTSKEQLFYTFYSVEGVKDSKEKLARVYEYYLKNNSNAHIDTLLQICYSGDERVKDGFYIDFSVEKPTISFLNNESDSKSGNETVGDVPNNSISNVSEDISGKQGYSQQHKNSTESDIQLADTNQACAQLHVEKSLSYNFKDELIREMNDKINEIWPKDIGPDGKVSNEVLENCFNTIEDMVKCQFPLAISESETLNSPTYNSYVDAFFAQVNSKSGENIPIAIDASESKITEEEYCKNLYRIALINQLAVPGLKRLYFIPLAFTASTQIGHIVISTGNGAEDIKGLLEKIKTLSFVLMQPMSQATVMASYSQIIRIEYIKSAVATLMARNMSHNLGSHYLTNTKNYFRKRIDIITSKKKPTKDSLEADYRGNVHLLQYIKERMDFIATVVSSVPYSYGSLNFKAQLFDVLTEDDHGARHDKTTQNFLLKYLVFSEKLTRNDKNGKLEGYSDIRLRVVYETEESCEPVSYTGTVEKQAEEEKIKFDLSQLELAVPGGLMGRHAFFCIIENIIRNSAKHSKEENDLVISIKLKLNDEGKLKISIYDNRQGGEDVLKIIEKHFGELVILNEKKNNSVDKNSKGLKEMLICALWLKNENVAEKLYEIQSQKDCEKKKELIKKYLEVSLEENNLCYTIKDVPLFKSCYQLKEGEDFQVEYDEHEPKKISHINLVADKIVNIHADIVAAEMDYSIDKEGKRQLSDIFPRFIALNQFSDEEKEKWGKAYKEKNSQELFELYDNKQGDAKLLKEDNPPTIVIDSEKYSEEDITDGCIKVKKGNIFDRDWTILFKNHLDSKTSTEDKWSIVKDGSGKYLESESGENFTSTIATFDFLRDPVNRYKVVEAANTRIAIIDERIFGDFQIRWKDDIELEQKLLEMRGIYLLNFDKESKKIIDLKGDVFATAENINFVSIHLGLLDKNNNKETPINIKTDILDKYFGNKTFLSIHSGRGNFSADLEDKLKNFPFISLSALEAAFYDCKYFLTQLFKTTNYYGKGNITDK